MKNYNIAEPNSLLRAYGYALGTFDRGRHWTRVFTGVAVDSPRSKRLRGRSALREVASDMLSMRVTDVALDGVETTHEYWTGDWGAVSLSVETDGHPYLHIEPSNTDDLEAAVGPPSRPDVAFSRLLEPALTNTVLEHINPGDIGAMTDNPFLLTDELDRDDAGDVHFPGRVWAYEKHMTTDPIEKLLDGETIRFRMHP